MGKKNLQRTTAVFRHAIQSGRATFNPAAEMRGVLKHKKVSHHSMIKPEILPEFLKALTNGLIRQYLPKKKDLSLHSQEELDLIANQLNLRPRKILGFLVPSEVLWKSVALTN